MNLAEIRENYPQYNDLSDQDLSDRLYNKYYADKLSKDDFYNRIGFQPTPPPPPAPTGPRILTDSDTSSDFMRGITNYLPQLRETLGGAGVLTGRLLQSIGAEATGQSMIESGVARMQAAQPQMRVRESDEFTTALEKGVFSLITDWLPYQMGQGVASIAETAAAMLAGAGLGAVAGMGVGAAPGALAGAVSKSLVKKGIREQAAEIAAKEATKEAGEKAAQQFILDEAKKELRGYGATAGLGTMAGVRGAGEVTGRAVEEAERRGEAVGDIPLDRVLPAAALHAIAEFVGDRILLGALDPKKLTAEQIKQIAADPKAKIGLSTGLVTEVLKNIGITGIKETPVEVIQSAAERFGAQLDVADAEALKEYINSTAAAFGMVAPAGTVGGVRTKFQRDQEILAARAAQRQVEAAAQAAQTGQAAAPVTEEADLTEEQLQALGATQPGAAPAAEVTPPAAEVTPPAAEVTPTVPTEPARTPQSFAAEIAAGKKLDTPEDVQYYQNNAEAIEAELQKLKPVETPPTAVTPTAPKRENYWRPNPDEPDNPSSWQDTFGQIHFDVNYSLPKGGAITDLVDSPQSNNVKIVFTNSKGEEKILAVRTDKGKVPYWYGSDLSEDQIRNGLGDALYNAIGKDKLETEADRAALVQRLKEALTATPTAPTVTPTAPTVTPTAPKKERKPKPTGPIRPTEMTAEGAVDYLSDIDAGIKKASHPVLNGFAQVFGIKFKDKTNLSTKLSMVRTAARIKTEEAGEPAPTKRRGAALIWDDAVWQGDTKTGAPVVPFELLPLDAKNKWANFIVSKAARPLAGEASVSNVSTADKILDEAIRHSAFFSYDLGPAHLDRPRSTDLTGPDKVRFGKTEKISSKAERVEAKAFFDALPDKYKQQWVEEVKNYARADERGRIAVANFDKSAIERRAAKYANDVAEKAVADAEARAIADGKEFTDKQKEKVRKEFYDRAYANKYIELSRRDVSEAGIGAAVSEHKEQGSYFLAPPGSGVLYSREAGEAALDAATVDALKNNRLSEALFNLVQGSSSAFNRALSQRLLMLLRDTRVIVKKDLKDDKGNPVTGAATLSGSAIYLDADNGLTEETLLHEGVHAAIERLLRADPSTLTPEQRAAVQELKALHARAKALGILNTESPAYKDLSEFVTESLTDPDLRNLLSTIGYKRESGWEGFKKILLKLLGLDMPVTMLDAVVVSADTLFMPTKPTGVVRPSEKLAYSAAAAPMAAPSMPRVLISNIDSSEASKYNLSPAEMPHSVNWFRKYIFSRPGFRYLAQKVQNRAHQIKLWENTNAMGGRIDTLGDKINNIYTQIVLSTGKSKMYYNYHLKELLEKLDQDVAKFSRAYGRNTADSLKFLHILSEALHEPERRMIKYLQTVPLTTDKTLMKNGVAISPADRRNEIFDMLKERTLSRKEALYLRNELDKIVFKDVTKDPSTNLIIDTSINNLTTNVDPYGSTPRSMVFDKSGKPVETGKKEEHDVDIESADYNVTAMSHQDALENRRLYENHPQKALIDEVLKDVQDLHKQTTELNKIGNHWTQPVSNIVNFYNWKHYVPLKGRDNSTAKTPVEQIEEALDFDRASGKSLQDADFKLDGRVSVSNEPLLQSISDAVRAAMRAGRVNVTLAVKNSLKKNDKLNPNGTNLIDGEVIAHLPFKNRTNEQILKYKTPDSNTIFHHNDDGSIDVLRIRDKSLYESIVKTYDYTNPLVDIANRVTSLVGQFHTRYNYQFAPMNFVRDALTNAFVIGAEMGPAQAARFLSDVSTRVVAGNGLYKSMRVAILFGEGTTKSRNALAELRRTDSYSKDMIDYIETGGMVSYIQGISLKSNFQDMHRELGRNGVMRTKEQLEKFLDVWNDMFELASRSAAFGSYKQFLMKKKGFKSELDMSADQVKALNEEAAAYVKNLANFEQVGEIGRGLGALYMFIRPAATGAVRAIEAVSPAFILNVNKYIDSMPNSGIFTHTTDKDGTKTYADPEAIANFKKELKVRQRNARVTLTSLTTLGYLAYVMAMMMSDDDDLGRNAVATDNMQQWTRFARFHIPKSITEMMGIKEPVIFQMPWGFGPGAFAAAGSQMAAVIHGANHSLKDALSNIFLQIALDSFMPIPVSRMPASEMPLEFMLDSIAPSVARPLLEFALNKNGLGQDIYNDRSRRMGDAYTAGDKIPEMYKDTAQFIADWSVGKWDVSPNTLYFLANSYMDGPFRVLEGITGIHAVGAGQKSFNPKTDLPLMGSFFGARSNVDSREFTIVERKVQDLERQYKMFESLKMSPEKSIKFQIENPMAETIIDYYNKTVGSELNRLRKEANEVRRMPISQSDKSDWLKMIVLEQNLVKRRMIDVFNAYGLDTK
jgi:Large polyvalent protein associated domain 38